MIVSIRHRHGVSSARHTPPLGPIPGAAWAGRGEAQPARAAGGESGGGRNDLDRLLLRLFGQRDREFDDAVVGLCLDLPGIDARG